MTRFRKQALKVGKYHSPDGVVDITPQRLKHWQENFRRMRAANYDVENHFDHAVKLEDMLPRKASEKRSAANTVGKLSDFTLNATGDAAIFEFEVTDPNALGRAERNEVYISPVILDAWQDGHKNQYTDVITCVDFVNKPVDPSQGPFVPVEPNAIACALRMGLSMSLYRMGDADEKDDDKDKAPEFGDSEKPAEEENPDMPSAGDASESDKMREALLAHLAQDGYVLPADTTAENLVERLLTAAMTKNASAQKQDAEEEAEPEEEEAVKVADPGFAAMSLQAQTALTFSENQHRKSVAARFKSLLEQGRCTPVEHTEKLPAVGAIKLSLNGDGQHQNTRIEDWLEDREKLPVGTFWDPQKRTQALSLNVVELPDGFDSRETPELAEKLARGVFARNK